MSMYRELIDQSTTVDVDDNDSGGQILRRLTRAALRLDDSSGGGTAIYEFGEGDGVKEAKEKLRAFMDGLEAQGACCALRSGRGRKEGRKTGGLFARPVMSVRL